MYLVDGKRKVLAVVVAIDYDFRVRRDECRLFLELVFEQVNSLLHRFVKEPVDEAEREHVAALEDGLIIHARVLECLFGQRRQGYRHNLYGLRDAEFRERIVRVIERLLEVFIGERVGVHYDHGVTVIKGKMIIEMRLRMVEMRT